MKSFVADWFSNAAEDCVNAAEWLVTHITTVKTGVPVVDGVVRTSFSYAETVYADVMVGSLHILLPLAEKVSTLRSGMTRLKCRSCCTGV